MSQSLQRPCRQVRVLLIAPSLDIMGGQAVQARRLVSAIAEHDAIAIEFQPLNASLPPRLVWLQRVKFLRTVATFVLYCAALLRRVPHCDIVHIFSAGYWSYTLWSVPAMAAARLFRKRSILNYRDGRAEGHLRHWRSAVPTIKLADVVVSPSEYVVDVFRAHGFPAYCIHNIIDVGRFSYRERRNPRPVFLHNRGFETLYNVPCTVRAFAIVQTRYPDASLTLAHDGPLRGKLERLVRDLGLRNVRFVGRVPNEQMSALYDSADIYLMSPNLDCMPGSVLECFASGLPVVATKAGGIPYMVQHGETGLLVDLDDDAAMASCALQLLETPGLAVQIASNAYYAVRRYESAAIRDRWVGLYRELIGAAAPLPVVENA